MCQPKPGYYYIKKPYSCFSKKVRWCVLISKHNRGTTAVEGLSADGRKSDILPGRDIPTGKKPTSVVGVLTAVAILRAKILLHFCSNLLSRALFSHTFSTPLYSVLRLSSKLRLERYQKLAILSSQKEKRRGRRLNKQELRRQND
jgi:hypothetical protein